MKKFNQQRPCINNLLTLLRTLEKTLEGALRHSQVNLYLHSLSMNTTENTNNSSWIINSGATDHIIPKSKLFHTYDPCPSTRKFMVANGSLSTFAGIGDIHITPTKWKIGFAKEGNGLYYLEYYGGNYKSQSFLSTSSKDTIWLYHLCLGHYLFSLPSHHYILIFKLSSTI